MSATRSISRLADRVGGARRGARRAWKLARHTRTAVRRAQPVLRRVNQVSGGLLAASSMAARGRPGRDDALSRLERLGSLRDKGVLTQEEFDAKKDELLRRV